MFATQQSPARIERAKQKVRRMGYEFHCPRVRIDSADDGRFRVTLETENRGVAPFYYDWKAQWGLLREGQTTKTFPASGQVTGLLPDQLPRQWTETLDVSGVKPGTYTLAVRIPNPMPTGFPLRFANQEQDADVEGWLSLGMVQVGSD